jgi:hypothetical protein
MKRSLDYVLAVLLGTIPFAASANADDIDLDLLKPHHHHQPPIVPEVNVTLVLIPIAFAILLFASRQLFFKRGNR